MTTPEATPGAERRVLPEPLWLIAAGVVTQLLSLALLVAGAEGVDGFGEGPAPEYYLGVAVGLVGTSLLLVGIVATGVRLGLRSMGLVPGQGVLRAPAPRHPVDD